MKCAQTGKSEKVFYVVILQRRLLRHSNQSYHVCFYLNPHIYIPSFMYIYKFFFVCHALELFKCDMDSIWKIQKFGIELTRCFFLLFSFLLYVNFALVLSLFTIWTRFLCNEVVFLFFPRFQITLLFRFSTCRSSVNQIIYGKVICKFKFFFFTLFHRKHSLSQKQFNSANGFSFCYKIVFSVFCVLKRNLAIPADGSGSCQYSITWFLFDLIHELQYTFNFRWKLFCDVFFFSSSERIATYWPK